MVLRVATSAALVGVVAGTINLAIEDCGDSSTHGHVSGISPSSVDQGHKTLVSGSGNLNTAVADGSFTTTVKAAGVTVKSCKGDICGASSCPLPAGTGSVDFHGVACPLAAGDVSLDFDVTVSKFVPSSLAHLEIDMAAEGSAGKLLCAKLTTSPAMEMTEGACTADEQATLADPQNTGKKANDCGTSSYNIFTGNFNHDKFNECFSASIGITKACSECYAATGEYGAKNCKADCILGWCKAGCLSCTVPAQETLAQCTGFTAGAADPCEENLKVTGGTINLAIKDCGDSSTHGHVSGISPSSVTPGQKTLVSGSGHLDTAVADGSFTTNVKAAGVTVKSCKGDICGASSCPLPAGTGSVDFHGVACPLAAGDVSLDFDVTVSKFVPSSLAHLEIDMAAEGSAGKLLCAKLTTSPAMEMTEGACTADEQATLADPQNTGTKANTCGTSAYNIFTGNFNHDKFNECFAASIGITKACSECYAATGEYGAKNCKASCILGWCKAGCLSCTEPAQETLAQCTGFSAGAAEPCEDFTV